MATAMPTTKVRRDASIICESAKVVASDSYRSGPSSGAITTVRRPYNKVRYRGLEKNTNRLYLLAGFTNLLRAERYMAT